MSISPQISLTEKQQVDHGLVLPGGGLVKGGASLSVDILLGAGVWDCCVFWRGKDILPTSRAQSPCRVEGVVPDYFKCFPHLGHVFDICAGGQEPSGGLQVAPDHCEDEACPTILQEP